MLPYLVALGVTLVLECPTAVLGYRSLAGARRSFVAALATNLAIHGLLWTVWPYLSGPYAVRVTIAEIDLRVGGAWRYVSVTESGMEVAFHGEYREIVPNERIVSTEVYEGMPEAEAVDTLTFTETDGRTLLTLLVQHTSKEHRDAHVESGMEDGLQDALDLLEEVAGSLL